MASEGFRFETSPARLEKLREAVRSIIQAARERFDQQATPAEISELLCTSTDAFLVETLEESRAALSPQLQTLAREQFSLIGVGGTGRGDQAPYSDVDLLFLVSPKLDPALRGWIEQVIRDCWDSGLKLGHSVRTESDCIVTALEDNQFATSLTETRLIWGEENAHQRLRKKFTQKIVNSRRRAFCEECLENRNEEQQKHGGAVLALVPDIKRSCGGLRDWHFLRWLTFAEFGDPAPDELVKAGLISAQDHAHLLHSVQYLSVIRNELHFQAGKAQDLLTREEQLRLATQFGFQATMGQRAVERFMQRYFLHALQISRIAKRMQSRYEKKSLATKIVGLAGTHRESDGFRIGWNGIDIEPTAMKRLTSNPEMMVRLFHLAAMYGQLPRIELIEALRQALPSVDFELSTESARRFREILRSPAMLEPVLRSMDDATLLERIVPDVAHAHCLLQFNQYHAYTVDEHTFRAIAHLTSFREEQGELGRVYRSIQHPEVVHLAMLLHDLGKGFEEDHSEVGTRIAERIGRELGFPEAQQQQLMLLVNKHLLMPNTAFWHDTTDPKILADFGEQVGSIENLKMLYVLTAADVTSVGPEVWTDWKAELLSGLYQRAHQTLSKDGGTLQEDEIRTRRKEEIVASLLRDTSIDPEREEQWLDKEFDTLPLNYLVETTAREIASDLEHVSLLKPEDVLVEGTYQEETESVEFRIFIAPEHAQGCFHRIAGALSAQRMEILTAQICTTSRGVVVDRFLVQDNDFTGIVPYERIRDVCRTLEKIIRGQTQVKPLFSTASRFMKSATATTYGDQRTKLNIDNESSDRCTVVEVFTFDRRGLLYALTRVIFETGLSIELAKIGTHLEQVVDVFYVTDSSGGKVLDESQLRKLRERLQDLLDTFDNNGNALDELEEEPTK